MAQHRKWKLWFLYFNCSLILSFFKLFPWKELFGAGVVCVLWEAKILLRDVNVRENEGFILTAAAQLLKNYIYEWLLHRPGTSLGLGASEMLTHMFVKPPTPYTQLWIHLCLCCAVSLTLPWRRCVLSRCYLLSAGGPTWNLCLSLFFLYWHLDLDIFVEIHLAIYRRESISGLCSVSLIYMAAFLSFLFLFFFFVEPLSLKDCNSPTRDQTRAPVM